MFFFAITGFAISQEIQVNTATVSVPEGGGTTTELQVMLTADPGGTLTVTADNIAGDVDIQPSPDPWTFGFNSGNWNVYQNVPLTAAEDADAANGTANIQISDNAGVISSINVTATEQDNDTLNGAISLLLNPSEATSGQDVSVSVQIANNNEPLSSFGFAFVFDSGVFSFEGIQVGTLTSNWSITTQTVDQNRVRIEASVGRIVSRTLHIRFYLQTLFDPWGCQRRWRSDSRRCPGRL